MALHRTLWLLLGLALTLPGPLAAEDKHRDRDLYSLPLEELGRLQVNVATGTPKPLATSPAATTLLLRQDFIAMGARTVEEALTAVPGLYVAPYSGLLGSTRYYIRGIASVSNAQALIMVNGIPMTTALQANSVPVLEAELPLEMVERIEVIRGPGSALYGADAFAGVINIITRDGASLAGRQFGASYGSFNSGRVHYAQGGQRGEARAGVLLAYAGTDGANRIMHSDAQTLLDNDPANPFPPASLAPGPVNQEQQRFDLYTTVQWQTLSAHLYWREVWDHGANQGLGSALDPWGELAIRRLGGNVTWRDAGFGAWELETRVSFLHTGIRTEEPFRTFPPGAFGSFPEGVQDEFDLLENRLRLQALALYLGWEDHRLSLGAGLSSNDLYESRGRTNYVYTTPGAPPSPRPGGLTDVSDTPAVFVPERDRQGAWALVQDEWRLNGRWELTTGLRFDHYSDFGDVLTPRAALTWRVTPALTSKLLYGEAFRAPSFSELYVTSNPFALGNPGLRPERLRSTELAFNYRASENWSLDLNLYRFRIRDFIDFRPLPASPSTIQAANLGRYDGKGAELAVSFQQDGLRVTANASLQSVETLDGDDSLGVAPRHKAYLRVSQEFGSRWLLTGELRRVGPREQIPGSPYPDLDAYLGLDLNLRHQLRPGLEVYLTGRNVLDADIREPGIVAVEDGIPMPGRSLSAGFIWRR